jgi:DNA-binding NarL/FixJ family response regulator
VWFRRWLRASGRGKHSLVRRGQAAQSSRRARGEAASANGRLVFEVDPELSAELRLAARAHDKSPEALVTDLLTRGLEREARRAQAEAALAFLTPREQEIAWLTTRGHTNHQIAKALVISSETVKTHIRHVLDKFGVRSKADLRLLLLDLGVRWWEG